MGGAMVGLAGQLEHGVVRPLAVRHQSRAAVGDEGAEQRHPERERRVPDRIAGQQPVARRADA